MTDTIRTYELRYVGARFEGAHLPVDVLSDLPAFRDLLVAYAKANWRKANPHRRRVPKGFDQSLSLDLVAIKDGSAIPQLVWSRNQAQLSLPDFADQLETVVDAAYADILALVHEAGNQTYPTSLPAEHVRALNKLGAGLRTGEKIEFVGTPQSGNVIYLDVERRRQIITKVTDTYQARFEGIGKLVANSTEGVVKVATSEHGQIDIHIEPGRILEEFDGSLEADIQFDLQIELDNSNTFRRVVDVFEIGVIDAEILVEIERCRARLTTLKTFSDGWHDGSGVAIKAAAISAAEMLLTKRPLYSNLYRIYPSEVGGVLIELATSDLDATIEIGVDGTIELFSVRPEQESVLESFDGISEAFLEQFDALMG